MDEFKTRFTLEQRLLESTRVQAKYPGRVPVIVEIQKTSKLPKLDRSKFLVPSSLTIGQFMYVIRKKLELSSDKAIFAFVKNILPPTSALMSNIYDEFKEEDNYLYISICEESVYGS